MNWRGRKTQDDGYDTDDDGNNDKRRKILK